jgi:hypothetical protein
MSVWESLVPLKHCLLHYHFIISAPWPCDKTACNLMCIEPANLTVWSWTCFAYMCYILGTTKTKQITSAWMTLKHIVFKTSCFCNGTTSQWKYVPISRNVAQIERTEEYSCFLGISILLNSPLSSSTYYSTYFAFKGSSSAGGTNITHHENYLVTPVPILISLHTLSCN